MAHFAEIDVNNIVLRVLVVPNEEEHRGEEFLANDLGLGGRWIQTSYNGNFRKRFAGIGWIYDEELDIFLYPQPFPSWTLNKQLGEWVPPIPVPNNPNFVYTWNESTLNWDSMIIPIVDQNNL